MSHTAIKRLRPTAAKIISIVNSSEALRARNQKPKETSESRNQNRRSEDT
jgi:hypothetical protein